MIHWASLFEFWRGWTWDVIPVFYGEGIAQTLSTSNTWFAYYPPPVPPTLRMFSLLPDSHSFGVLMLLGFLISVAYSTQQVRRASYRWAAWVACALFGVAIFVNGSRGIWLAAVPTALVAYIALIAGKRYGRTALAEAGRIFFLGFLLLTILFPASSHVSGGAHGAGIENAETNVGFLRARSILDLDETSNRGRIGIWVTNAKSVLERPLFGVGIGNGAQALDEDIGAAREGASAHNLYLDFAVETGLLGGLLILAWFLVVFFRHALLLWHTTRAMPFVLTLVLATAWIGAYNLVDIVFINDRALLAFLSLLAFVTASQRPVAEQATIPTIHA